MPFALPSSQVVPLLVSVSTIVSNFCPRSEVRGKILL